MMIKSNICLRWRINRCLNITSAMNIKQNGRHAQGTSHRTNVDVVEIQFNTLCYMSVFIA